MLPSVSRRDRLARLGASGAFVVQGMILAAVLSQVSVIQDAFAFTEGELTIVLALVPIIAGVGSLTAGFLAPKFGSAAVLRVAVLGDCLGALAVGWAGGRIALYGSVVLLGFAIGGVDACMNMQGVAVQRRYGRSILASCHGWWTVGGILSSYLALEAARRGSHLIGGAWIELTRTEFLTTAAVAGVLILLCTSSFLLRPGEEVQEAEPGTPIRWWPVVVVGLAVMVMFIGDSSTTNWSTVFLSDGLHATGGYVEAGLFGYLSCQLVGRILADRAIGRFGATATAVGGALIAAAGFGVVATASGAWAAVAGFALAGAGLSVVVPLAFSAADGLDPAGSGVAIARLNLFNYAGVIIGTVVIGVVAEGASLRAAFWVPGALVLTIILLAPSFRAVDAGIRAARQATMASSSARLSSHDGQSPQ